MRKRQTALLAVLLWLLSIPFDVFASPRPCGCTCRYAPVHEPRTIGAPARTYVNECVAVRCWHRPYKRLRPGCGAEVRVIRTTMNRAWSGSHPQSDPCDGHTPSVEKVCRAVTPPITGKRFRAPLVLRCDTFDAQAPTTWVLLLLGFAMRRRRRAT